MPIKAVDLRRYYTVGGTTVKALDGVSLDIADGEYVTICGASGSGKSTLMNILGCLDSPTSGSYILAGEEVPKMADSQLSRIRGSRIGFVFQSFNLIPTLTARENVELPLMYRGVPRKQRREAALEALEQVGLAGTELIDISTGQECKDSVEDHEEGRAQRNNTRRPTSTCAHALDESCKGSANHHVAKHNDDGGDGNRPTGEFQIGIPGVRIRFHLYYS